MCSIFWLLSAARTYRIGYSLLSWTLILGKLNLGTFASLKDASDPVLYWVWILDNNFMHGSRKFLFQGGEGPGPTSGKRFFFISKHLFLQKPI